jgi:hypothetical protein
LYSSAILAPAAPGIGLGLLQAALGTAGAAAQAGASAALSFGGSVFGATVATFAYNPNMLGDILGPFSGSSDPFFQHLRALFNQKLDSLSNWWNSGGGGGGGGGPPRVLQTGGHTISKATREALKLSREEAKFAMEGLKGELLQKASDHGHKIWSNGDVTDLLTGKKLGNLYHYLP